MGRAPCCDKANVKRGPWSPDEDNTLRNYLHSHGTGGNWIALPRKAGLRRCGKSCRLRWLNYLRPDIKHGGFTEEEDNIICSLYTTIGSRWSAIATQLPGRTDNDVKNYWNTKLKKKLLTGKVVVGINQNTNHKITTTNNSTRINHNSSEFSTSFPVTDQDLESRAYRDFSYHAPPMNAKGSTSYMTEMMYYESGTTILDEIDTFPNYSTTTVNNQNNCYYNMPSSQEVSSLSGSYSFPLEINNYATWYRNGDADQDQGVLLDIDFEGSHYPFHP